MVGCGLVFCVAFGFGGYSLAVVLFALVVSSRSALVLVVLRVRWFRLPFLLVRFRYWFLSFCVCGGFVCPFCCFAFDIGFGRSARAVFAFGRIVGARLALVLVVLRVRWFRCVCSLVRPLALVDAVGIFPKSEKFAP